MTIQSLVTSRHTRSTSQSVLYKCIFLTYRQYSNKTSLTAVDEAFSDAPGDEKGEAATSKDPDSFHLTEQAEGREEVLRRFKKEFSEKVCK
jgi:hypothetical protein